MTDEFRRVSLRSILRGMLQAVFEPFPVLRGLLYALRSGPNRAWSIGRLLEEQARRRPARPAIRCGGEEWTYAELNARANRVAAVLAAQGIGSGDVVAVMAETRPELLACIAGIVKLGGVAGMINYNLRDEVLDHSIGLIRPKVIITSAECVAALSTSTWLPERSGGIQHYWLPLDGQACPPGFTDLDQAMRGAPDANPATTARVKMGQPCFYIFTSGTTGMPKASVMTHYRWLMGMNGVGTFSMRLTQDDVLYVALPFYHNNALTVSWGSAMGAGACLALSRRFSASRFWDEIRRYHATSFCYIGEVCRYLLNQPPSPKDREHAVRVIAGNGLRPDIWMAFRERFGIRRIVEFYGASEANLAFINYFNVDGTAGMCPLPYAIVAFDPETEDAVRDKNGHLVRVGAGGIGLLVTQVNRLAPFEGYTDDKATEKKLFRNAFRQGDAWFNSGDLVRDQGWKHIQFVDRLGDTFRWKGENVATTEVEAVINADRQVEQSVVYGVQVPHADGRAGMAALALRVPAKQFDAQGFARRLRERLPAYAMPLFLRLRSELEVTGTFKNRKVELKSEAFDPARVSDPLYWYAGPEQGYRPLDAGTLAAIRDGTQRP